MACRWAATCRVRIRARRPGWRSRRPRIPDGGQSLDRVQVIKGWVDAQGETHEKVFDAAWSNDRKPGADGKLPSVGTTVDVANASYSNSIGAAVLDYRPGPTRLFNPAERAYYYSPRDRNPRRRAGSTYRRQALRRRTADHRPTRRHPARLHLTGLVRAFGRLNFHKQQLSRESTMTPKGLKFGLLLTAMSVAAIHGGQGRHDCQSQATDHQGR